MAALVCFWTLIGLSFAFQFYISSAKAGLEVTWRQAVSYALGDWYVFALLSIPVVWLARRFDFESGHRRRSLAAHLAASLAFSLAYMVLRAGVGRLQSEASFAEAFLPLLVKTWHFNLLIYWVIVAVTLAFDYYRKYRERELSAVELEKRLAEAKLQALQMQLNPHFLFNSLHSISALMHQDVEAADRMIVRLSDFLRAALESSDTQEVTSARGIGISPALSGNRTNPVRQPADGEDGDRAGYARRPGAESDFAAAGGKCDPPRHRTTRQTRVH